MFKGINDFRITGHPFHLRIDTGETRFHAIAVTPQFLLERFSDNHGTRRLFDLDQIPIMAFNSAYAILGVMGPAYEYPRLRSALLKQLSTTPRYITLRGVIENYSRNWREKKIIAVRPKRYETKLREAIPHTDIEENRNKPVAVAADTVESVGSLLSFQASTSDSSEAAFSSQPIPAPIRN